MTLPMTLPPLTSPMLHDDYPFETPAFHAIWQQTLASRFDLADQRGDLAILRKKVLRGWLTIREARISGWNSAWGQQFTETRARTLLALDRPWDYFRFTAPVGDTPDVHLPHEHLLQAAGHRIMARTAPPHYLIDLSDGFDAYLKQLSHNGRKALRKKVRQAEPLHPHFVPVSEESGIRPFFNALFGHHRTYWTEKAGHSYFSIPAERAFIVAWAEHLFRQGDLYLERLIMGGDIVNLSMGVRAGDIFYWLLTVNTGRHHDRTPGMVALAMRLETLAAAGVRTFHMGPGDYFYKAHIATHIAPCRETLIFNRQSLKAQLYRAWLLRKHPDAQEYSHSRNQ